MRGLSGHRVQVGIQAKLDASCGIEVGQRPSLPMNKTLNGRAVHNFSEHKGLQGNGRKGQQQYQGWLRNQDGGG